jgi:hypothetical protein
MDASSFVMLLECSAFAIARPESRALRSKTMRRPSRHALVARILTHQPTFTFVSSVSSENRPPPSPLSNYYKHS